MDALVPITTTTLGLRPEVAARVVAGLSSPNPIFERLGGVVRRIDNKRVVAWLRPMTEAAPSSGVPAAILAGAAASGLALSITGLGFQALSRRLATVEEQLGRIEAAVAEVNRKLDSALFAKLKAALQQAQDAQKSEISDNRQRSAHDAIGGLLEGQQQLKDLLAQAVGLRRLAAFPVFNSLLVACAAETCCRLEVGEIGLAKDRLGECCAELRPRAQQMVEAFIGSAPGVYLQPAMAKAVPLARYVALKRRFDPGLTDAACLEQVRVDLWQTAVQKPSARLSGLPEEIVASAHSGPLRTKMVRRFLGESYLPHVLCEVFGQAEQVAEGVCAAEGFHAELDFVSRAGLSYASWKALRPPPEAAADDVLLLVPQESELAALLN
jgi:hypothetical protein